MPAAPEFVMLVEIYGLLKFSGNLNPIIFPRPRAISEYPEKSKVDLKCIGKDTHPCGPGIHIMEVQAEYNIRILTHMVGDQNLF